MEKNMEKSNKARRNYSREFKAEAAALAEKREKPEPGWRAAQG
jgi:transposase-like protein